MPPIPLPCPPRGRLGLLTTLVLPAGILAACMGIALCLAAGAPTRAYAASNPDAPEYDARDAFDLSPTQVLRQLTVDLFHRLPTDAEYDQVAQSGHIDAELARSWVQGDEARSFFRRYHSDLLWPAFDPFSLVSYFAAGLLPSGFYEIGGDPTRLFLYATSFYQRGALVACKDEPAEFDETGYPILEPWPDGTMRDGWVWVEPYWAPGTQIKVCALEARAAATTSMGVPCDTFQGMVTGECGCGANLDRCASPDSIQIIEDSLREQLLRAVMKPIEAEESYYDFLTDTAEQVNGPLVYYYTHLVRMAVEPLVFEPPVAIAGLPDIGFTDESWHVVQRGPEHSGILTQIMYLLRFQTARSRAARYYDAFLCSPFVAPEVDLPSPSDPCTTEPDLRERCGCSYCHTTLEPASAHWGRFTEAGSFYLQPDLFPDYRASCAACGASDSCDFSCDRFYFTRAGHEKEVPFLGRLKSHVFRDEDDLAAIVAGPKALVASTLANGQLARCTTTRLFERLMGRGMTAAETTHDLPQWQAAFEESGYRFDELLVTLLTDARYGRMQP